MIEAGTKYVKEKSVPSLMVGSYYTAGVIGRIGFISLFSFCSCHFKLQEMEELKNGGPVCFQPGVPSDR